MENTSPQKTETAARRAEGREQLSIVIVGHVDHGKSTIIGRLLADAGALPEGKLEDLRERCRKSAKPFEYAFLLDALKNEQTQGITIDTARCFFKTARRDYIINDAPGHIEFLKNMVTGAARAEAALLVIDAHEGVQENSRRHGYMVSMLGIRQVSVVVNKLDLMDYSEQAFEAIRSEYAEFLARLGVETVSFIPVSARNGVNIASRSDETSWYRGPTVLEQIESFVKPAAPTDLPLRMPVQDIYRFTEHDDDRRILAGIVQTGSLAKGDEVIFQPSGKRSTIARIEGFNSGEQTQAIAGQATGVTLTTQIYIKPGELMCRADQRQPRIGTQLRANLFWMGKSPMVVGRPYRLRLGAARVQVNLAAILNVLDASELSTVQGKGQVDRHDVAECLLETVRPIAFDLHNEIETNGRFVIVDNYEISGCGVILEQVEARTSMLHEHVIRREFAWDKGNVDRDERQARFNHKGRFIVFTGPTGNARHELAKRLEQHLFRKHCNTYYLGIGNVFEDLDADEPTRSVSRDEHVQQLGELARIMTDAGLLLITTLAGVDDYDLERLKLLNEPNQLFIVNVGENIFSHFPVDVQLPDGADTRDAINVVIRELNTREVLLDYCI